MLNIFSCAICISSLEECLFRSFDHFSIGLSLLFWLSNFHYSIFWVTNLFLCIIHSALQCLNSACNFFIFKFIYLFIVFCLFRAAPVAYGGSQAMCVIRAIAACLCHSHSTARSKPHLQPYHSSWQCWILIPLSEARDWTHNLMVPSRICFHCVMMGTPQLAFLKMNFPIFLGSSLYFLVSF